MVLHVIVCLFLVFVVLLQSGKGAEMGATFGGSSQTLFGSRGAATFLNKLTTAAAILFMLTSLVLTMVSVKKSSVINQVAPVGQKGPAPSQSIPAQPLNPQQPIPAKPLNSSPAAK